MKIVEYRITYGDGSFEIARVKARNLDTGFVKAWNLRDQTRELHSIEFWQVRFPDEAKRLGLRLGTVEQKPFELKPLPELPMVSPPLSRRSDRSKPISFEKDEA